MNLNPIIIGLITFMLCEISGLHAQQAVTTTGGIATGEEGSASYTVGQVVYQTNTGPNGTISEGVQQPYEISIVTTIDEMENLTLSLVAFPNPTYGNLTLEIKDREFSGLTFQLFDFHGKILETQKIYDTRTQISMDKFMSGIYFIKVSHGQKALKTFKVIKK